MAKTEEAARVFCMDGLKKRKLAKENEKMGKGLKREKPINA